MCTHFCTQCLPDIALNNKVYSDFNDLIKLTINLYPQFDVFLMVPFNFIGIFYINTIFFSEIILPCLYVLHKYKYLLYKVSSL